LIFLSRTVPDSAIAEAWRPFGERRSIDPPPKLSALGLTTAAGEVF